MLSAGHPAAVNDSRSQQQLNIFCIIL